MVFVVSFMKIKTVCEKNDKGTCVKCKYIFLEMY